MILKALILAAVFNYTAILKAQNTGGVSNIPPSIYYTYAGPLFSISPAHTERESWSSEKGITSVEGSLLSYSGGVLLSIFAEEFTGEITLQYIYHSGEEGGYSLYSTTAGKYMYRAAEKFYMYPAVGFWFSIPPSSGGYGNGGGLHIALGALYDTTPDTKLFGEGFFRYGYIGQEPRATTLNYGFTIGFIFKIGTI